MFTFSSDFRASRRRPTLIASSQNKKRGFKAVKQRVTFNLPDEHGSSSSCLSAVTFVQSRENKRKGDTLCSTCIKVTTSSVIHDKSASYLQLSIYSQNTLEYGNMCRVCLKALGARPCAV